MLEPAKSLPIKTLEIIREPICFKLKINETEFQEVLELFNSPQSLKSNKIYSGKTIRLVMFYSNFLSSKWHIKRSKNLINVIKNKSYKKIYYLGFGAIDPAIVSLINNKIKIVLSDNHEDAFLVAKQCFEELSKHKLLRKNWRDFVFFEKNDLNKLKPIKGVNLVVALDALEHASDPDKAFLEVSKTKADIFLSVPVCKKLAFHNKAWLRITEAHLWVTSKGYTILKTRSIKMGAKDTFAKGLHLIEEQVYATR